jgi:hypothetical protein
MENEMSEQQYGELHIYPQYTHHDNAQVKGTRLGLEALAAAIAAALKDGEAESAPVFVNDGEGYTVLVECVENADALETAYVFQWVDHQIAQWQARAFEAEAALYRLRKGIPEPALPTPEGAQT